MVEKQVPVTVDFQGNLVAQYRALKPVIEPEMVTIAGPSKIVSLVNHAVALVDVEGKKNDFQSVVTYSVVNELGDEVLGVSHAPSTVRVNAAVELMKEVQVEAVLSGSLLEGYALSGVQSIPDTILIQGDAEIVELIERVETTPIDISLLSQTTEREVTLNLPEGIHPANGDRIVARIEVEPLEETVIEIPSERVEFYQVDEGMRAFTNPHTVFVTVQAPQSVIQDLTQRNLRLYVNLQGFAPGVYKVPIEGVLLVDGELVTLSPNEMEVVVIDETEEVEPEVENQE